MKDDFLPEGYEIPTKPYMKFELGENRFRILASPVVGWEYWTNDSNVVRSKTEFTSTPDIKIQNGKTQAPKHFWAMKVWNYKTKRIEILEITQVGIQESIKGLSRNEKWGSPLGYDIVITKTGEGLSTEYTVFPEPKTNLTEAQELAFADTFVNLEALFTNSDPFQK